MDALNSAKDRIDSGYRQGKERVDNCTWLNRKTERLESQISTLAFEYFTVDAGIA